MTRLAGGIVDVTDFPRIRYIRKAANESVTSSTTMQDDNDLVGIVLAPNQVYKVDFFPAATGAAAGDVKFAWTVTGTVAGLGTRTCLGSQTGTTDVTNNAVRSSRHNLTTSVAYGVDGTATGMVWEAFLVEGGTLGGTLTLQWAQNTSNATATQLSTSTYMTIQEVEEY